MLHVALIGKICDTKNRGRQRTKYKDSLNNFVTRKESPINELIGKTDDREGWQVWHIMMMIIRMMMMI